MTALLAPSHFRFRVDLMPDEKVLWEGGAQRNSIWAQAAKAAGSALLLVGIFAALIYSSLGDPNVDKGTTALRSAEQRAKVEKERREFAEWHRYFVTRIGRNASLLILGLGVLGWADAWLRYRRSWYVIPSERVCIQTGSFGTTLTTIDLDKIVSVQASSGFADKPFGLQDIELVHAGASFNRPGQVRIGRNPYVIAGVAKDSDLLTHLVSEWLPRDGRRRAG